MSIRTKLLLAFLLILLGGMSSFGTLTYLAGRQVLLDSTAHHLESVAASQKKSVEKTIRAWKDRVALIASRTQMRVKLRAFNETRDPALAVGISRIIADARASTRAVECVTVYGADRAVVATTAGPVSCSAGLPKEAVTGIVLTGLSSDDRAESDAQFFAPLRIDGETIGTIQVILRAQEIADLTGDYTGLGETGETVVAFQEDTGGVTLITPIRFHSERVMTGSRPVNRDHAPMVMALTGQEATIMGGQVDYKGSEVMAVTRHIPELGWGLVVKMDRAEALRPLGGFRRLLSLALVSFTGLGVAIVILVSRSLLRPIKELAEAAEGIRGGGHGIAVAVHAQDEIGLLAETFNAMSNAVEKAKTSLEDLVAERTRALTEEMAERERSERKFTAAFHAAGTLMSISRIEDGTYEDVNEALLQATGFSRDEVVGRTSLELGFISADDRTRLLEGLEKDGRVRDLELELIRKDGSRMNCLYNGEVISFGGQQRLLSIAQDITERKQAEAALQASERQKKLILDTLPDLVWLKDVDGAYLACNPVFERFFGATEAEIAGKTDYDFVDKDLADSFRDHDRAAMEADGPSVNEEKITFADDGHEALLETIKTPLKAEDGTILGVLGIGRDITLRARVEEDLRGKNEELERSNTELESFAYVSSHDLREPLRNVTHFSTLLQRKLADRLTEEERGDLQIVHEAALRMDHLVRDLLNFSRVGRLAEPMTQVSVRAVIDTAVGHLYAQLTENDADLEITADFPEVLASRDDLERVFTNLIGNALKYRTPDTAPRIAIGCRQDGAFWRFHVRDNGIGIEPGEGYEERIFGLFQRLHQRDEFGGGTGIGLAISKKIVERHGGRIWVESAGPGEGSTFYFTLPAS